MLKCRRRSALGHITDCATELPLCGGRHNGSDALEQYLAHRREEGRAYRTINADLVAVRSFCRWLISKRRIREDPTLGLRRLNIEEDRRRQRRPLTDDESRRLIDVTFHSERQYRHLSGLDRSSMYTLALRTGLRRNELRSLKPGSFDLDSDPPLLKVEAANSKRRKTELLPLPPDVAEAMQKYLAGRPTDKLLWPGSWWTRAAEMLRLDLAEAGIVTVNQSPSATLRTRNGERVVLRFLRDFSVISWPHPRLVSVRDSPVVVCGFLTEISYGREKR